MEDVGPIVGGTGDGVVDKGEMLQVWERGQMIDLTEAAKLVVGQNQCFQFGDLLP